MSTRSKPVLFLGLFVSGVSASMPATAQRPETPRITVMTFQSSEKELGAQAADILRSRLAQDFSNRTLQTVPTVDISNFLESSGFPVADPLQPNEEYTLAKSVRADMYVTGTVIHLQNGYRIEPKLVLTRELRPSQPLPVQMADRLDDMMDQVSRSVRDAMKQLNDEKQCVANARNGKVREAIAAAKAGSTAYPMATLTRLCAEAVYYELYRQAKTHADSLAYSDSALMFTAEVLQRDPLSLEPLKLSVDLFRFRRDTANYHASLMKLIDADSSNTHLLDQIVNELALSGSLEMAQTLTKRLLDRMPGDPQALRTALRVYTAASNWTGIVETGTELAKADTSATDSSYYSRMGVAYNALKEPAKAAEVLAQGTAKFPTNAKMWFLYSRMLDANGQTQEARTALRKAVQLDPKTYGVFLLQPAEVFANAGQYDSAYTELQQVVAEGAPVPEAATMALGIGNKLFVAANPTKDRAGWQEAIKFLQLSNKFSPSVNAQFVEGATAFSILQSAATEAAATKSCSLAQLAQASYTDAQTNLAVAVKESKFQSSAQGMLQYLPQFKASIDSQLKLYCK